MDDDEADQPPATVLLMINSWQATLMLGLVTIVLGVIVIAHPNGSLRVLAVLIGIAAIISGLFQLIRAADRAAQHRLWLGVCGLVFIALGVVLIRHLHLTLALVGLLVGVSWIVQGIAGLMSAFCGPQEGAVWWAVFGSISLIAGVVVTASPLSSVTVLAVLVGIWLLVIGLLEIVAGLILQHKLAVALILPDSVASYSFYFSLINFLLHHPLFIIYSLHAASFLFPVPAPSFIRHRRSSTLIHHIPPSSTYLSIFYPYRRDRTQPHAATRVDRQRPSCLPPLRACEPQIQIYHNKL